MTDKQLPPPPSKQSKSSIWGIIALVVTLICSAGLFALFWQAQLALKESDQALRQGLETLKNQQSKESAAKQFAESNLVRYTQELQGSLAQLKQQVMAHSAQLGELKHGNRLDWLLSESEYLLRLANQRLSLEQDVRGAELILNAADSVLAEADDPALTPVRVALAEEILALQSIKLSDTKGAFARINALIKQIDQLEVLDHEEASHPSDESIETASSTPDESNSNSSPLQAILNELRQAVRVSSFDQDQQLLLTPDQHYYLRQNLRLMLEQASLALLNQEDAAYQSSLTKAEAWIHRYFSANEASVQAALDAISTLKNYQFQAEFPDISGSLRLLKAEIESLYRKRDLMMLAPAATPSSTPPSTPAETQTSPAQSPEATPVQEAKTL